MFCDEVISLEDLARHRLTLVGADSATACISQDFQMVPLNVKVRCGLTGGYLVSLSLLCQGHVPALKYTGSALNSKRKPYFCQTDVQLNINVFGDQ